MTTPSETVSLGVEGSQTPNTRPSPTPTSSSHRHITPASPSYPPYGYIDPNMAYEIQPNGYDPNDPQQQQQVQQGQQQGQPQQQQPTYVIYPVSPQFYYSDYQSYPGSPALHPQSPPINPTSPPFSPTYQYHPQGVVNNNGNVTLSPTTHATYVLPPHTVHPQFPPLHISSPVLTGTPVGSPPHQVIALPSSYHLSTTNHHHHQQHYDNRKRHHHHPSNHNNNGDTSSSSSTNHQHPVQQVVHQEDLSTSFHPLNVYVRGLPNTTNDESFLELCKNYGDVQSSKAILDQKTGECKGYGFALFESEQDCHDAIEGLNSSGLQASFARVGQESFSSRLRSLQDETSTNIYISNLPLDITEQKLEELFHPHNTISNRILRDPQSGISRGVGFARMSDRHAAVSIIDRFNGQTVPGSSAPLQVRFADSPAQKKLKNQTTRKRMVRPPREFQSMTAPGFPIRHMMPITPETMLGIAPLNAAYHPQYATIPAQSLAAAAIEGSLHENHDTTKDQAINDLAATVEKDLKITDTVLEK